MKRIAFILLTTSLALVPVANAEDEQQGARQWEFSVSGGTNGIGLDLSYRVNDNLRVRGGYHFYDLSIDTEAEDNNGTQGDELKYNSELQLSNLGLLADWYPWGGVFRVSGGAVVNQNDFRVKATCDNPAGCEVGDSNFSRTEIGTVTVDIDIEEFGPYLGIGWDKTLDATKRWLFSFDVGAFYQGSPTVEMTSNGSCATSPITGPVCRAALEDEERELEDELDEFKFYPVISIGIGYRF